MAADPVVLRAGRLSSEAAGARIHDLFVEHGRMVYGVCRLLLRDGRKLEAPFKYSRGEKPEPEAMEQRMEKFATLTRDRLTDSTRKQVIEMVERLDTTNDVAQWTAAIHKLLKPVRSK